MVLVLGSRDASRYFTLNDAIVLGIVILGGLVVFQIPLWIAARSFRWRLIRGDAPAVQTERVRSQFHLRHIMLGMVFLSLALAPARAVLPKGNFSDLGMRGELYVPIGVVVVCNLLVTVPCIWGAFVKRSVIGQFALGWFVYCAVVTGVEYLVVCGLFGVPGEDDVPFLIYLMNVTQCVTVFGPLLVLRGLGFQLVRLHPIGPPPQAWGSQSGTFRPARCRNAASKE